MLRQDKNESGGARRQTSSSLYALSHVASFGLLVGAAVLVGYYFGTWLDKVYGTAPWLMILCLVLFIVGAFVKFIQITGDLAKREKRVEEKRK